MFQKFYTDTLGSRFIKSLLAQTPVPLFDCVVDGDHLVEGRYYVYKRFIIKCASSGVLAISDGEELYPSPEVFPSVYLYPKTGLRCATFYVKSYVDEETIKTHSVFKSSTNYYDSETHYHLGRYLQYLYSTKGLNLFPFYNVYNSTYFSDVQLSAITNKDVSISRVDQQKYKVVGIPIRFGHTYSISIDCPTQVLMRACIHDDSGYIDEESLPTDASAEVHNITDIKKTLADSGRIYSSLRFDSPVTFRIETNSTTAMMLQHNLYLIIQLPLKNDSSIVVLENFKTSSGVKCDKNFVRTVSPMNLSLLKMNTRCSYAFSDRLIEYLLGNVISHDDQISQNVSTIQSILGNIYSDYRTSVISGKHRRGVWDQDISRYIQAVIEDEKDNSMLYDQDGNVNKDTELILYSKGGKI